MIIGLTKARFIAKKNKDLKGKKKYKANFTSNLYKAPEVINQDYDQRADI